MSSNMRSKYIGNGKYKLSIEIGRDIYGKRRRKTFTLYGTKEEVIKQENELMSKYYHSGDQIKNNDLTFKELSKQYLDYCKNNISSSTLNLYKSYLNRINKIIGSIKIDDINTYQLDMLYQKLKEGKRSALSNRTLSNYRKLINAVFMQAIRWGFIEKNPNKNTNKPKKEHEEKTIYSIQEVQQLLNALNEEPIKFRTIITLALDSGARKGEICALRWSDIDFDNHIMKISKSLKVIDGKADESRPKTNSSHREVILSESTINLLLEYKEWQSEYIRNHKDKWVGKEERVFTSLNGRFMNPVSCNTILSSVIKKHGLKEIPFHSLRHTCASVLLSSGIDVKTVSKRLGHKNASMTLDVYSHVLEESNSACADKFEELIKNS